MRSIIPGFLRHLTPDLWEPLPPVTTARPTRPVMRIVQAAYLSLMEKIAYRGREEGGLLIGPKDSDVVTGFVFDDDARRTATTYTLGAAALNSRLLECLRLGYDAKGVVHSHPDGAYLPSAPDLAYVTKALSNPKNAGCHEYLLPIVCSGQLFPYAIRRDQPDVVLRAELVLL